MKILNARGGFLKWPSVARICGGGGRKDFCPSSFRGSHQSNGLKGKDGVAEENGVVGNPGPRHSLARHEAVRIGVVLRLGVKKKGNVSIQAKNLKKDRRDKMRPTACLTGEAVLLLEVE